MRILRYLETVYLRGLLPYVLVSLVWQAGPLFNPGLGYGNR